MSNTAEKTCDNAAASVLMATCRENPWMLRLGAPMERFRRGAIDSVAEAHCNGFQVFPLHLPNIVTDLWLSLALPSGGPHDATLPHLGSGPSPVVLARYLTGRWRYFPRAGPTTFPSW